MSAQGEWPDDIIATARSCISFDGHANYERILDALLAERDAATKAERERAAKECETFPDSIVGRAFAASIRGGQ